MSKHHHFVEYLRGGSIYRSLACLEVPLAGKPLQINALSSSLATQKVSQGYPDIIKMISRCNSHLNPYFLQELSLSAQRRSERGILKVFIKAAASGSTLAMKLIFRLEEKYRGTFFFTINTSLTCTGNKCHIDVS